MKKTLLSFLSVVLLAPLLALFFSAPVSAQPVSAQTAGITITEAADSRVGTFVSETGSTQTFQVVLNAQPASNVTLTVTSSDIGEATIDKPKLT